MRRSHFIRRLAKAALVLALLAGAVHVGTGHAQASVTYYIKG